MLRASGEFDGRKPPAANLLADALEAASVPRRGEDHPRDRNPGGGLGKIETADNLPFLPRTDAAGESLVRTATNRYGDPVASRIAGTVVAVVIHHDSIVPGWGASFRPEYVFNRPLGPRPVPTDIHIHVQPALASGPHVSVGDFFAAGTDDVQVQVVDVVPCQRDLERKEPNKSGVAPPHSKEAYRPMGHGKANPVTSGRFECPQKEFGRNRLPMAGRPGYNAGSRNGTQQNVGRTT